MGKYTNVEAVKNAADKVGDADDGIIETWIKGVEAAIDTWCNRPDGFVADATASIKFYSGEGYPYLYINECTEITLVEVKDSATDTDYVAWATADWIAFKGTHQNPDFNDLPYNGLMVDPNGSYDIFTSGYWFGRSGFPRENDVGRRLPTVRITAKWGYATAVPADIAAVAIALSERMYKQGKSGFTDSMANAQLGALTYIRENQDIRRMLNPWRISALG